MILFYNYSSFFIFARIAWIIWSINSARHDVFNDVPKFWQYKLFEVENNYTVVFNISSIFKILKVLFVRIKLFLYLFWLAGLIAFKRNQQEYIIVSNLA